MCLTDWSCGPGAVPCRAGSIADLTRAASVYSQEHSHVLPFFFFYIHHLHLFFCLLSFVASRLWHVLGNDGLKVILFVWLYIELVDRIGLSATRIYPPHTSLETLVCWTWAEGIHIQFSHLSDIDFHSANCIRPRLVTMAPLMLNMRWTAPTRKELALYLFVIRTFYDIPLPRRGYGDRAVDSSCALCQETLPSHASRSCWIFFSSSTVLHGSLDEPT